MVGRTERERDWKSERKDYERREGWRNGGIEGEKDGEIKRWQAGRRRYGHGGKDRGKEVGKKET